MCITCTLSTSICVLHVRWVCVYSFDSLSLSLFQCIRRFLDRVWSPASVDDLDDPPVLIKEHTSSPPPPPAQFTGSDIPTTVITLNKNGGTSLGFSIAGGKGQQLLQYLLMYMYRL